MRTTISRPTFIVAYLPGTTADREIRLIIAAMQHCRARVVLLLDRAL